MCKWVEELKTLSKFAETDPHAAYAAFTYGFSQKWKYIQRTIPNIEDLFKPLEDCISQVFIPALLGRAVSDTERAIFELPTKLGGLNITNPVNTAQKEYDWSRTLTQNLTSKIKSQTMVQRESSEVLQTGYKESVRIVKSEKLSIQKSLFEDRKSVV